MHDFCSPPTCTRYPHRSQAMAAARLDRRSPGCWRQHVPLAPTWFRYLPCLVRNAESQLRTDYADLSTCMSAKHRCLKRLGFHINLASQQSGVSVQDSRKSMPASLGIVLEMPFCLCTVQVLFPVLGATDDGGRCLYTLPAAWTVLLPILFVICIAFPRQASLPQARRLSVKNVAPSDSAVRVCINRIDTPEPSTQWAIPPICTASPWLQFLHQGVHSAAPRFPSRAVLGSKICQAANIAELAKSAVQHLRRSGGSFLPTIPVQSMASVPSRHGAISEQLRPWAGLCRADIWTALVCTRTTAEADLCRWAWQRQLWSGAKQRPPWPGGFRSCAALRSLEATRCSDHHRQLCRVRKVSVPGGFSFTRRRRSGLWSVQRHIWAANVTLLFDEQYCPQVQRL